MQMFVPLYVVLWLHPPNQLAIHWERMFCPKMPLCLSMK